MTEWKPPTHSKHTRLEAVLIQSCTGLRLIDVLIKDAVCLSARDGAGGSRSDSDVRSGATLIKHDSWETHKHNVPFISDEDTDALAL